jgi:hypothetical protein
MKNLMVRTHTFTMLTSRFVAIALFAALLYPPLVSATSILGTAENFAVLAGTPNITNTGTTTITGDVGIHPVLRSLARDREQTSSSSPEHTT